MNEKDNEKFDILDIFVLSKEDVSEISKIMLKLITETKNTQEYVINLYNYSWKDVKTKNFAMFLLGQYIYKKQFEHEMNTKLINNRLFKEIVLAIAVKVTQDEQIKEHEKHVEKDAKTKNTNENTNYIR